MLNIRPYRDGDLAVLVELVRELQAHEALLYELMKPAEQIGPWYVEAIKKECSETAGTILIAEMDGEIVGYASVFTDVRDESVDEIDFTYAYVGDLVTVAKVRGQGVGRALLDECERHAREAGRDEMRIDVLADNSRAHEVYQAFGFDNHLITMRKKVR